MAQEREEPGTSQETTSLVKRLAGPSTGKAGLAADQSEINRIITEASKGSQFYENEKRKDRELTERIRLILKQRDVALAGADIHKIELSVDKLILELESQRDLTQIIVHVDMDAFFANVELLHDPSLKGKPFGVGHGVLTTASYEARKYGVRSGMPGFIAKKLCPELIFVPNTFSRYTEMSNTVMTIFKRYDPAMAPAGCDEGYLNITAYCNSHNITAEQCVQEMRKAVYDETGLTVSAGISPNKLLAKICSDKNKPNGQYQLTFDSESIISFMRDLPIRKVPGIGRVNERLLEAIEIKTCGDIYTNRAVVSLMDKHFGLQFLLRTHLGIASNIVQPHQRTERKSIGAERTFAPLNDTSKILNKLKEVAAELEKDMEEDGWVGKTITLKYKLETYQVITRARSSERWITNKEDLYTVGKDLLWPELPLSLRLIGLRLTKLKDLRQSNSSTGIKRFFEPLQDKPHRKRSRLENNEIYSMSEANPMQEYEEDHTPDELIRGFCRQDERSDLADFGHDIVNEGPLGINFPKPRPSVPARISSSTMVTDLSNHASTSRLRSTSDARPIPSPAAMAAPSASTAEFLECPVCGKKLEVDNQGLNTHIDFCLSRGAIRQAHAEASSPVKLKLKLSVNYREKGTRKQK